MNLASVIEKTGLTKIELARLYAVSRQTIHTWVSVGPRVGSHTARMAERVSQMLLAHAARGYLPLPPMERTQRGDRITRMVKVIQEVPPAPAA